MTEEYAAHCDCNAFGVSTTGTEWDRRGIENLAKTHLENCRGRIDSIEIVKRIGPGENGEQGPIQETVVDTVTREVPAQ